MVKFALWFGLFSYLALKALPMSFDVHVKHLSRRFSVG